MSATDQQANVRRCSRRPSALLARFEHLHAPEKQLVEVMHHCQFGKFENVRIVDGLPELGSSERLIRSIKLGAPDRNAAVQVSESFPLKAEVIELFHTTRGIESGLIRRLEFRHGLPGHLELEVAPHHSIQVDGG